MCVKNKSKTITLMNDDDIDTPITMIFNLIVNKSR